MTTEAKVVDVLAVMGEALDSTSPRSRPVLRRQLVDARAAVAELVEAARDFRDCLTSHSWNAVLPARRAEMVDRYKPVPGTRPVRAAEARMIAALARIGGGAA